MRDFFFQIVIFLAGAVIGVIVPLLRKREQKIVAGVLAILLISFSLIWAGYELGIRETPYELSLKATQTAEVLLTTQEKLATPPTSTSISPSPTVTPTATSQIKTPAVTPLATPTLTNTPHSTPTLPVDLLAKATVILDDSLDNLDNWIIDGDTQLVDGFLRTTGAMETNYQIKRTATIVENQAALVLFRFKEKGNFEIFIYNSEAGYRRVGLGYDEEYDQVYWSIKKGSTNSTAKITEITLRTSVWYYLLIKAGEDGVFEAHLWERDLPTNQANWMAKRETGWDNLAWRFSVFVNSGTVELDEYKEFDFKGS